MRASAFSVPPQQFVTSDGGIAEMGGDIQYGIVDVVTMVSEVVNHQEILRSLSKTLLVKTLVRKSVRQIQKERLSIGKSKRQTAHCGKNNFGPIELLL